jgi:hypothetical protein
MGAFVVNFTKLLKESVHDDQSLRLVPQNFPPVTGTIEATIDPRGVISLQATLACVVNRVGFRRLRVRNVWRFRSAAHKSILSHQVDTILSE